MDPLLPEERQAGLLALVASTIGWLLSYLGLFAGLVFLRAQCATGGGSEMQLLGMAFAGLFWTCALGLLALGRRGLGKTGWLGLGHAVAFVPALVWLAPALRHSTLGGLAVCLAFEESAVREIWPLPATLLERIYPVATLAVIAALAIVAIRGARRGRLAASSGPLATAESAREPREPRSRRLLLGLLIAVAFVIGGFIAWARAPQGSDAPLIPEDAGRGAVSAQADAGASDEERCRSASWPRELRLDGPDGPRAVDCRALYCRSIDACEESSLPWGEPLWCGHCEKPRACNPTTRRCCRRSSDAELCAACKSADEVLEVSDCGLKWRVVCDGCCVSDQPLTLGYTLGLVHLAVGGLHLEPDGRATLEQSEVERPATTSGTWKREGKGLVARFEVDTATADGALIDFACAEDVANDTTCAEADQRACFRRRLDQCLKSHWAEIERRFGKRSARFEVTVELQRGPKGEMLSRIQGSDPKPVRGKERFEAPGSAVDFKATDECFFVPR